MVWRLHNVFKVCLSALVSVEAPSMLMPCLQYGIDADEILKIMPSQSMDEDVLAWVAEKSGVYSVRSAYRMLKTEQARLTAEKEGIGDTSSVGIWWKRLSKLKIPPKVRIFWWRVIRGFLPSNAEMKRRHIRQESNCDACGNPVEDLYHVLVDCPWARRFWSVLKETLGKKLPVLHPTTWATDILSETVCSKQDAAIFVCGCWTLWSSRNARVHGRSTWNPSAAVRHVAGIVVELMCMKPIGAQTSPTVKEKWTSPPEGWLKINSDGSFDCNSGQGAGAAVIRDHNGVVVAATARWYKRIHDPLVAEALAACDGLRLAKQLGLSDVILESDNSVLVKMLNEETPDRSLIAGIWYDCGELCKFFHNVKVCFVRREGNSLADRCVKEVSAEYPAVSWLADVPQWLKDAAAIDCNLPVIE